MLTETRKRTKLYKSQAVTWKMLTGIKSEKENEQKTKNMITGIDFQVKSLAQTGKLLTGTKFKEQNEPKTQNVYWDQEKNLCMNSIMISSTIYQQNVIRLRFPAQQKHFSVFPTSNNDPTKNKR